MYLIILLLLLLIAAVFTLAGLLIFYPVKLYFTANSEQLTEYRMIFTWLNPLLSGSFEKTGDDMLLKVYLFKKRILKRCITKKLSSNQFSLSGIREMGLNSIKLQVSYGFEDPFITGMVYGAVNLMSDYLNIDVEYHHADFYAENYYFSLKLSAEAKPIKLLRGYLVSRSQNVKLDPIYGGR